MINKLLKKEFIFSEGDVEVGIEEHEDESAEAVIVLRLSADQNHRIRMTDFSIRELNRALDKALDYQEKLKRILEETQQ